MCNNANCFTKFVKILYVSKAKILPFLYQYVVNTQTKFPML